MFTVDKAIILAAGLGERLRPLTESKPKPLLAPKGQVFIESIIEALCANNIKEIYIVVGYLKEAFELLLEKYPFVKLIENPYFNKANNISSLYVARNYIKNTVILDGDQLIYNPAILSAKVELPGYCCSWTGDTTNEWLLTLKNNRVIKCDKGGSHGWQLYSVSFWDEVSGAVLAECLEDAFKQRKLYNLYWDDVPLFEYADRFSLGIREIKKEDLIEIDSYEEWVDYHR